jgi:dolichol-phosphate mannosyltransferase
MSWTPEYVHRFAHLPAGNQQADRQREEASVMNMPASLSIIVPVYNEQRQLDQVLKRIYALDWPGKQIILVNDGSSDGTRQMLQPWTARPDTILLHHATNQGKGAAIRTGLAHASGEIVIIQDADLEYDPAEILQVVAPIIAGQTDVCFGSRFLEPGRCQGMALPNRVANWILAWLVSLLFGQRITDEATAYKAFRRKVLEQLHLQCHGFEFCPEVTAQTLIHGYRILEVPVSFHARTVQEGKKIGLRDFFVAIWTLLRVWGRRWR